MELERSIFEDDEVHTLNMAIQKLGLNWVQIQKSYFPNHKITQLRKIYNSTKIEEIEPQPSLRHCSSNVCTFDANGSPQFTNYADSLSDLILSLTDE
ncbi:hypothetical protein SS50377_21499 [Spironucleus salmonicida]|uniref:Myb-like DNA-binding domain-containing protein n=1 Tax=Spironucleus salmonicida TaxID=348837 RepID=V6LLN3_9EUKA|nr:hypothetical protein SS50377_21499 [Spironucleus salmonicida]|eukprot:EST45477.1 Hypothetical protein SS50377_14546 [Spironucleus salmonicida]